MTAKVNPVRKHRDEERSKGGKVQEGHVVVPGAGFSYSAHAHLHTLLSRVPYLTKAPTDLDPSTGLEQAQHLGHEEPDCWMVQPCGPGVTLHHISN